MKNQQTIRAWLEILRLPNLFTVIGDPLAGCALTVALGKATHAPNALVLCIVSLSCYVFGLLTNDLHDLQEDRIHRKERPLPSNRLAVPTVRLVALLCALLALLLSAFLSSQAFLTTILLLIFITAYNYHLKTDLRLGAPTMGLCRALNLLLGAVACGSLAVPLLLPAIASAASVTFITILADKESLRRSPSRFLLIAPTLILAAFWIFLLPFCHAAVPPAFVCWLALLLFGAFPVLASLSVRQAVGCLLVALIPWQFSLIGLTGICGTIPLIVLMCLLSLAAILLSRFLPQS
jgi:4-hydroxybenzoate polyprenyltransferase